MKEGFYIEYKHKKKNNWIFLNTETKEILNIAKWVLPLLNHGCDCENIQAQLPEFKNSIPTVINYIKDVFPKTAFPDYENNVERKYWSWPKIREVRNKEDRDDEY